MRAPQTEGTRG